MREVKIGIIEPYAEGHHAGYARILTEGILSCGVGVCLIGPQYLQEEVPDSDLLERIVLSEPQRKGGFRHLDTFRLFRYALHRLSQIGATHAHFLYGDWHMLAITIALITSRWRGETIVTVHWSAGIGISRPPRRISRLKSYLHRLPSVYLARRGASFIVHDESIGNVVRSRLDTDNVYSVPYPAFPLIAASPCELYGYRLALNIPSECHVLLCFGDTRYEKGVDLAVRALESLPEKYHLLIAGRLSDFSRDDIDVLANDHNVQGRVHYDTRYLPEDEVTYPFGIADIVLLPYRRGFSGQSGPLTCGAALGKKIVGARLSAIETTVLRYSLGALFNPGDAEDMARAIKRVLEGGEACRREEFLQKHSPQSFASAMVELYLGVASRNLKEVISRPTAEVGGCRTAGVSNTRGGGKSVPNGGGTDAMNGRPQ